MTAKPPVSRWYNVGCHPTPDSLVGEFASLVSAYLKTKRQGNSHQRTLRMLDLFAGDGRLGNEVASRLLPYFRSINVRFVEIDRSKILSMKPKIASYATINRNAFSWRANSRFDVIVSNPPYQILNAKSSIDLGIPWDLAKKCMRNLYGLGIVRSLGLLEEKGVLAVIAPFGWIRAVHGKPFREYIEQNCRSVIVRANNHRGLFKGITQDTAIQLFERRSKLEKQKTVWRFGYNGSRYIDIYPNRDNNRVGLSEDRARVRVGPIVWNRETRDLRATARGSLPIVYGGNITHLGQLDFSVQKYKQKQYIQGSALKQHEVFRSPLILIRRTMRGVPGNWQLDSCLVESGLVCTVENHVIAIQLTSANEPANGIHQELRNSLESYYRISGSPTISGRVVRHLLADILDQSHH
jgi:hypothetical protein